MKTEINLKDLQQKSLFLAAPMYGGQCHGMFAKAIADLSAICAKHGITLKHYYLFNESLITRARNYCVDEFLRSDCSHMMFIDSDIGFDPRDVLLMLDMMDDDTDYDVLTGPYPKKNISWEKIKQAVDRGFADDNPYALEQFVGDYVFNPTGGKTQIPLNEPAEVAEAGTGFMMIRRATFEKYAEAYPDLQYKPDHVRTKAFDGSRMIHAYFDCIIDPNSKRYLSEDYMFCYNVRKAGMKVWMCPWMQLKHTGSYTFGGSLAALAAIGANATADLSKIGKK